MAKATAPANLAIRSRDFWINRSDPLARWWLNNDPVATAFYNSLSVIFPKGEGYLIDSVHPFRHDMPPQLAADILAYIRQEVIHTREHLAFNRHIVESGYDVSRLEKRICKILALSADAPPFIRLAITVALEHIVAIISHQLIRNPAHLKGADADIADLWRWHAAEEIEHKGVAYDAWMHATRNWSGWRRWRIRSMVMLATGWTFFSARRRDIAELLAQDGISRRAATWKMANFAVGKPGMARNVAAAWLRYFQPGFHPWDRDDSDLIGLVDRHLVDGARGCARAAAREASGRHSRRVR